MKHSLIALIVSLFASSAMAESVNVKCDFHFAGATDPLQMTFIVNPPKLWQGKATHEGNMYVQNLGSARLVQNVDPSDINSGKFNGTYAELDWLRDPTSGLPVAHIRGVYALKLKNELSLALNFTAMLSSREGVLQRSSVFEGPGRSVAIVKAENSDNTQARYGKVSCTNLTNFEL